MIDRVPIIRRPLARFGIICFLGGIVMLSSTHAAVVSGVQFEPTCDCAGVPLKLRGAGVFRFKGLIKVTASALYLPPDAPSDRIWDADVPKCLVMEYFRDLSAADLVRSGDTYLRKNLTEDQLAEIARGVDKINRLYRDVEKGDRYMLSYRPGRGTQLLLNGIVLGSIPGEAFASYYLSIWLGPRPVSESMRDDLLALR